MSRGLPWLPGDRVSAVTRNYAQTLLGDLSMVLGITFHSRLLHFRDGALLA